jgi:hypothetical protein
MNETYVECMVKCKPNLAIKLLYYTLFILTVIAIILFLVLGDLVVAIVGGLLALAAYFAFINAEIEYEYLYIDRQLTVDKVLNMTRRKRVAVYDLERLEILAPTNSHELDSYRKRTTTISDYSCGTIKQPDTRYTFYYDGKQQIIFEPNEEMLKAIAMVAPRKVFRY